MAVMMIAFQTFLAIFAVTSAAIYVYVKRAMRYWEKKDVPTLSPSFPFGNLLPVVRVQRNFYDFMRNCYEQFSSQGHRYGGLYFLSGPVFMVCDPALTKDIMVNNFDKFSETGGFVSDEYPMSKNLSQLDHERWKPLRANITTAFTPAKLKSMHASVQETADTLRKELGKMDGKPFEAKALSQRYNIDLIANLILGTECNALEKCSESQLLDLAMKITHPNIWNYMWVLLTTNLRFPAKVYKILVSRKDVENFLKNLTQNIRQRDQKTAAAQHWKELMQKGQMSAEETASNFFVLCHTGFESTSIVLSFALYHIAANHDLQIKLREEIMMRTKGDISNRNHETLSSMALLDKVVKESVRMYPPYAFMFRSCVEDYVIPDTKTIIEKGTQVLLVPYGLHRDPKYFERPHEFDPSRFDDESKIAPFTYLPFGAGPKTCPAFNLALFQIKMALATVVSSFNLSVSSKTQEPIEMEAMSRVFPHSVKGGLWLQAQKISAQ